MQRRIASVKERLLDNAKVQEGDKPAETPTTLIKELNQLLVEMERLIRQINKTNAQTYTDGISLSDMLAKRDVLGYKISILRSVLKEASCRTDRYSNTEIRILSTINISEQQKEVDNLSMQYRVLDTKIQGLNWTTELLN